jgi:FkbM family methyltransferase
MANKLLPRMAQFAAGWMPNWMLAGMYMLGPISDWIRQRLNRDLPSEASVVEISSGPLRSRQMKLHLQSEKDYWLGSYEIDLIEALKKKVPAKGIAFDVGANIGYLSLVLAELLGPEGQVWAYEALPANAERLNENVQINGFEKRITLKQVAISAKGGQANFKVHASGGMGKLAGAKGRDEDYLQEIRVESASLDDLVFKQGIPSPDLIKIDIEGAEGAALQGASRLLNEVRPLLFIELHGQEAAQEVLDILKKHDYSLRKMGAGSAMVETLSDLDWKSYVIGEPRQ